MSVWTRMAAWLGVGREQRFAELSSLLPHPGSLGIYGGPISPESAARKVAIGSAIRLISNTGRTMPAHAFTGAGGTTKQLTPPPLLRDPDGTGRGLPDWAAQALWSLAARGNLVVQILTRNSFGLPDTILVLHPDLVRPEVNQQDGSLSWRILTSQGSPGQLVPDSEIIHRRMYPVPGRVMGLSPIAEHAATIGMGISAEKFGSDFFDSGGHPTALLKSAAPLTEDQGKKVKSKFRIAASSREPVLLPDGITYEQIQIAPDESMFLDAQGYSSAECARIFGPGMAEILGYETGGAMTYTNVVDRDVQLLKYTLDPYLVIIEDVLSSCLPKPHYVKLIRESLLRMNPLDRFRLYQLQQLIGFAAPNEQRDHEDLAPVAWGDKPYATAKLTETDQIGATPAAPPAKTGEPQ